MEEREGKKREREGKWQCSLLVGVKVLYEKSRFHRRMLSMIMTFSRENEREREKKVIGFDFFLVLLLILCLVVEYYDRS